MQRAARFATIGALAGLALVIGATGASSIPAAWADPPGGFPPGRGPERGGDHGAGGAPGPEDHGPGREEHSRGSEHGHVQGSHFQDHDRIAVHDYFAGEERRGRCPPGLAKKANGCLPPGQAKRWRVGAPLPPDVVYYSLPPALVVQLTPPPVGYKYVRVASDVLMIAAGTGMVAAAIEDLGR